MEGSSFGFQALFLTFKKRQKHSPNLSVSKMSPKFQKTERGRWIERELSKQKERRSGKTKRERGRL